MDLLPGFASVGEGWTFLPRLTLQETLNDNLYQANSPRRWDLITTVAPGIGVVGDTNNVRLRLNYQPVLQLHARTGPQNSLTQQLNATADVTVVPELLFVDLRGLAGVQATNGGIGGLGTVGEPGLGGVTSGGIGQLTQTSLSKQQLSQTTSFSISPYAQHQFGDLGTARLGVSLTHSSVSHINGFIASPWASGSNAQRRNSIDETASFHTGDALGRVRDSVTAQASQSYYDNALTTTPYPTNGNSQRELISNRVDYAFSSTISVYAMLGWQRINYSGGNRLNINEPVWQIGTTLTPNADTRVTFGYGRLNGSTSFTFDGRYALTARTTLTGSYHTGITTQTGLISRQLAASAVGNNGGLVNGQTGGSLFQDTNALGVSSGIFRFNTLTLGATTVLDRDTIAVTFTYSKRTPTGTGPSSPESSAETGGISWMHLLSPVLTLTSSLYYSTGAPSGGTHQNSIAASVSGHYTLGPTVSAYARYAFYRRQSSNAALSMYQDLFILGVTKHF